jgi:hypothetical protein
VSLLAQERNYGLQQLASDLALRADTLTDFIVAFREPTRSELAL